jgi:hypothetical protein
MASQRCLYGNVFTIYIALIIMFIQTKHLKTCFIPLSEIFFIIYLLLII